jgi:very-short-patch-repair endonuclease
VGAVCQRTAYLVAHGYRALCFWNNQVLNDLNAVVSVIENAIAEQLEKKNDQTEE